VFGKRKLYFVTDGTEPRWFRYSPWHRSRRRGATWVWTFSETP